MLSKNNFCFFCWPGLHAFVIVSRDVLKFILDELRQGLLSILEKGLQQPFQEMWSNMALQKLSVLKKSDFDSLLALGGVLGRYDAEGQRDAIGHACASLEHSLLTATEERRNQGKVYGTLSATAGAFLVILLL